MSPRQTVTRTLPAFVAVALTAAGALHSPAPAATAPAATAWAAVPRTDLVQQGPDFADLPATSVVADGPVDQVVASGDRVYAAGSFDRIGTYTGAGRVIDVNTGADLPAPVLPDGQVSAVIGDGNGGWFVGGDFGVATSDDHRGGLMHVLADGTVDATFDLGTNGLVNALELSLDTLYVGGQFDQVGSKVRHNLAAISLSDWSVTSFRADQGPRVSELVYGNGHLYVGTDRVTAMNPRTGAPVRGFTPTERGAPVGGLSLGSGLLYVGTDDLVAIDADTGRLDRGFKVELGGKHPRVTYVAAAGSRVYVGTTAKSVNGHLGYLAAVAPGNGKVDDSFDPRVTGGRASFARKGGVFSVVVAGEQMWIGGAFSSAGGEPASNIAELETQTGKAVAADLPRFTNQVNSMAPAGSALYIGGHFFLDDPVRTHWLAALDATTLAPLPGFRVPPSAGWYGELLPAPNALYLGQRHSMGYRQHAQQPPYYPGGVDVIAALDPDTGAPDAARTHRVRNLSSFTVVGNRLVVARRLQNDVKYPENRITVYAADGTKETSWVAPLPGYISYLTVVDGDLLAVGSFDHTPGVPNPWADSAMLRLDVETGDLHPTFDPHVDGPVYDAAVDGDRIYPTGLFHHVYQGGTFERPGLAALAGDSTWDAAFDPAPFEGNRVLLRTTAVGDLLWLDAPVSRFLDGASGAVVPDPTGGHRRQVTSVTAAGDAIVFGASVNGIAMEGTDYDMLGYVGRSAG